MGFVSSDSMFGTRGVVWWLLGDRFSRDVVGVWTWFDGCVGCVGFGVFLMDMDSGAVGCWLMWTGPRGLT